MDLKYPHTLASQTDVELLVKDPTDPTGEAYIPQWVTLPPGIIVIEK